MDEIWKIIKKYPKLNILIVSAIVTILLINETLNFAEKIINNILLGILSIIIFYFFVWIIIEEKMKNVKR